MRPTLAAALAALACLTPSAGGARPVRPCSPPYHLEVVDESGRALPTFAHAGRTYVLGALGQRYLLRVRNDGSRRVEAVVSVDGRDVVDGRAAGYEKRGYLIEPGREVTIDGFRTSTDTVAAFRFASVPRSYAALQGDARDVGVVGVALFSERERPVAALPRLDAAPSAKAAPGAASDAPAPQAAPSAEGRTAQPMKRAERLGLGTEFGEEHASSVRFVSFERASSRPDALLTVRYDDREGLLAAGVDVDGSRWARAAEARARLDADPFRRSFAEPPPGWQPGR